jgi:hypothetical protein
LVDIHFEIIEIEPKSFHSIVKAFCGGVPLNLILDTGASRSVLNKNFKHSFEIISSRWPELNSHSLNSEITEYGRVILPKIDFDKYSICDTEFTLIDFSYINTVYLKYAGIKVDGLLGSDFLLKHKAIIDYGRESLYLTENT